MEIITGSSTSAILMFFCILMPFACGFTGWVFGTIGKAQKDYTLQKVEHALFYTTTTGMFIASLALIGHEGAAFTLPGMVGLGLNFTLDGMRLILCILTTFCWLCSAIFTTVDLRKTVRKTRYRLYMLMTEGAVFGVFLAADLFTLLVFFEIMGICAWVLVCHNEKPQTMHAANSYLVYAILGGLVSLMGLFLLYNALGTLEITLLAQKAANYTNKTHLYVAGALTMFTFACKSAMFPLHTWLCQSYTAAPTPTTALLSTILSKTGIFGILIITTQLFRFDIKVGTIILIFGVLTMLCGAILGVFSVDLKGTLAYSSMSQIGFILVGVGMQGILGADGGLAVWGLILHICNHSLFKLCLFLSTSTIFTCTGRTDLNLNKIRGFGRGKILLMFCFGMASLGIMGVPFWSGYISKTLLHDSIIEAIAHFAHISHYFTLFLQGIEALFLFAGGLTVVYILKLFICIFIEKNTDKGLQESYNRKNKRYCNKLSSAVYIFIGMLSPILGLTAHQTMEQIGGLGLAFTSTHEPHHVVHYFSLAALTGAFISLSIGTVLYLLVVRKFIIKNNVYRELWPKKLEIETQVYKPLLFNILPFIITLFARILSRSFEWIIAFFRKILFWNSGDGTITPMEDILFTVYEQQPKGIRGFAGSLAFSLMLFGFGMIAILLYLLF